MLGARRLDLLGGQALVSTDAVLRQHLGRLAQEGVRHGGEVAVAYEVRN